MPLLILEKGYFKASFQAFLIINDFTVALWNHSSYPELSGQLLIDTKNRGIQKWSQRLQYSWADVELCSYDVIPHTRSKKMVSVLAVCSNKLRVC